MSREYTFDMANASIALHKMGVQSGFTERCQSFLYDKSVSGITLKLDAYGYGDTREEHKIRLRAVIFKDDDGKKLADVQQRVVEWESKRGNASSNMAISAETYKKILNLYRQDCRDATEEVCNRVLSQIDFEYSMPIDKSEDSITLILPVNSERIETDTIYRIGVFDLADGLKYFHDWPWFIFFHRADPVEKSFVPQTASLRVRVPSGDGFSLNKATRYHSYKDFYNDIHYDKVCEEVEVNPVFVCFELKYTDYNETHFPLFSIVIESGNGIINKGTAHITVNEQNLLTVYCPLPEEMAQKIQSGKATACLQVFDQTIARFPFLTNITEPGEYVF